MTILRQAFRSLLRQPLILLLAVLALGFGIGLPTAMFSLLDAAVLRGLPVPEPGTIVHLERRAAGASGEGFGALPSDYVVWQEARSLAAIAAFDARTVTLRTDAGSERWAAAQLTASAFPLLEADAALGRVFTAEDERAGALPVALLSHTLWRDRFESDPAAVGRTVFVDGAAHTVVGVMPPSFLFPAREDLWLPLPVAALAAAGGDEPTISVFARLAGGVSRDAARAEMTVIAQRMAQLDPAGHADEEITVKSFTERFIGENATRQMWIVLGAVLLVLIIACTNVAGLLLVRAVHRANEIAVHAALGASRRRLVGRLLAESAVLAVLGGLFGALVAAAAMRGLEAIAGDRMPWWSELSVDPRVLGFAAGATLLAALLAGVLPALHATTGDLARRIYDASRGSSGLRVGRVMQALVVIEVALSLALLVATAAMVRSVSGLQNEDLGLPGSEVGVARVSLPPSYSPVQRAAFFEALGRDVRADPGVAALALASSVPATHGSWRRYSIEGEVYESADDRPSVRTAIVSPEFFGVYDAEPVRGRLLDARDRAGGVPVAVVTPKFALRHFGDADPVGRRLRIGDEAEWRTIVGVVPELWIGGLDASGDRNPRGVYLPIAQSEISDVVIALRAQRGEGLALMPALRAAVTRLDPDVPVYDARSMTEVVAHSGWHYGLVASILGACGVAALLLATIGLYGVLAFAVGQRTREFGVRMAVGASPGRVIRHVLARGALQVALGGIIGIVLAVGLTRMLAILLFEVSPGDPTIFAAGALAVLTVALVAMLVPALRAARLDPLRALRSE